MCVCAGRGVGGRTGRRTCADGEEEEAEAVEEIAHGCAEGGVCYGDVKVVGLGQECAVALRSLMLP